MSLVVTVLFFISISVTSGFQIEKFQFFTEFSSEVIEFDSNGNAYVFIRTHKNLQLLKINSDKKIVWKMDSPKIVLRIIINSRDEVYVISQHGDHSLLTILQESTSTFQEIDFLCSDEIIMDEDDNLLYDKEDGVYILKRNAASPIRVKNLEEWIFLYQENFAQDNQGNIYLGLNHINQTITTIAVITKDAKQEEIPQAKVLPVFKDYEIMNSILLDQNSDIWAISWSFDNEAHVRKLVNLSLTETTGEYYFPDLIADLDRNIYVSSEFLFDQTIKSPLALVKYGEVNAIGIEMDDVIINSMLIDGNDDLWILTECDGVYYVKKGGKNAVKVNSLSRWDSSFTSIHVNKLTNEIFILSSEGLFFTSAEPIWKKIQTIFLNLLKIFRSSFSQQ